MSRFINCLIGGDEKASSWSIIRKIKFVASALILGLVAAAMPVAPVNAAVVLNVDTNGQLTGAQNVDVGGTLYDVNFVDGSCTSVFGTCIGSSLDFFGAEATATIAAQALLDQVFIDGPAGNFDSNPALTLGCSVPNNVCSAFVPFGFSLSGSFLNSVLVVDSQVANNVAANLVNANSGLPIVDTVTLRSFGRNSTQGVTGVFARFALAAVQPANGGATAVSEPASLILFGMGLIGVAAARRRRHPR